VGLRDVAAVGSSRPSGPAADLTPGEVLLHPAAGPRLAATVVHRARSPAIAVPGVLAAVDPEVVEFGTVTGGRLTAAVAVVRSVG
jgi:hypothetical protein